MPKDAMMFVDGANLFHGAKDFESSYEYDAIALRDELSNGYDLIRSYWFASFKPNQKPEKFYEFLEMNGYRVESKPLRKRSGGWIEKGADIGLATEMIIRAVDNSFDVAILVSGDDDFSRAVRAVENRGKYVIASSFEGNFSSNLKRTADEVKVLDDIAEDIRLDD